MAKREIIFFFWYKVCWYVLWAQCWLKENKLFWDLDFQLGGFTYVPYNILNVSIK